MTGFDLMRDLVFQRKWMLARLEYGQLTEESAERRRVLDQLVDLDLKIAAYPAQSLSDLIVKLNRYREFFFSEGETIPEDSLDHIYLGAILRDAEKLSEDLADIRKS